ncbi:MAG: OadG family protein [Oscillospiraceae bacterium]|jgi:Na+-transporting methylmalonyl-CoA/oxaloacetate decarboxylase gamma subunit|nr:OadG family protein [Oscillospiraceae bacterium]
MLFLTAASPFDVSIPDAFLLSLVGFSVVFLALMALIGVIKLINAVTGGNKQNQPQAPVLAAPAAGNAPAAPVPVAGKGSMVPAVGSEGDIDLYTVEDQTAALLMAIVADDLKAPLNTLRFISIREVK